MCILASAVTIAAQTPQQSQTVEPVRSNTIEPVKAKELKGNKQDRNQPQTSPARPSQQSDSTTQQDRRTHQPVGGGDSVPLQYRRNNQQQTNTPQPAKSNSVDPYHAKPVDPYKANDIAPVHSQPVSPVQGTDLQGNVQNGPGTERKDQRGNIEWRDRNARGRDDDRTHDRGERERAYQLERQRREAYERERREVYERERREAEERERREHDRRNVYSDRNSDRSWHGRGEERRREYFVSHDGQRIYVERDHSGRCTRRYVIADSHAYDVDSRGRRIFVERDHAGVERRYVMDGNRNRYEYVIEDNGRESLVQRDAWGRVKQREFYAEQPRGTIETYRADDVQPYQAEGIEPYQAQEVQPYHAREVQPFNSQDVAPLTSDQLKEMLAQDPALKKQMQDYAADLQRRGMTREDVLKAVYRRLNEIHAERVRTNSQDIEPYHAPNEPRPPREVGPDPSRYPRKQEPARSSGSNSSLFRTFGLAVPGVAYSFDNYATNTRTNVVATGALTKSSIRVSPDHTYIWNSAWDGKTIRGQWKEWKDGGVLIMHGQEGKDWLLQPLTPASGKATVVLYTDSVQYHGTPLD